MSGPNSSNTDYKGTLYAQNNNHHIYIKRQKGPESEASLLTVISFKPPSYTVLPSLLQEMLKIQHINGGECLVNVKTRDVTNK